MKCSLCGRNNNIAYATEHGLICGECEKMKIVEIPRLEENFKYGTFGVMKIDKRVFCVTLERPDLLNRPWESSIPAQQYICKRYSSAKYPDTFQIMDVPDRDKVLFHSANLMTQLAGCIALAQYFGKLKGDRAVLNSGATFRKFMQIMKGEQRFHLTITEHY